MSVLGRARGGCAHQPLLAGGVRAFFGGGHLLCWVGALSLLKSVGSAVQTLSSTADQCQNRPEYMDISDTVRDTLRFIRTSGAAILRSTPHLYLSALPFAPTQSSIFKKFAEISPYTPRVVAGHVIAWPPIEKILRALAPVHSVAISLDEKRVACGLRDGTIQILDGETGEALSVPFNGQMRIPARHWTPHSKATLTTFPPSQFQARKRVVSGSHDMTMQVWDADTGKA